MDANSRELLKVAEQARCELKTAADKIAILSDKLAAVEREKSAAVFTLQLVREGKVDPEDAVSFCEKVASNGVEFVKKAMEMNIFQAEGFGSLVNSENSYAVNKQNNGMGKTGSFERVGPQINGEPVDDFTRGFYELREALYGEPLPFDT